MAAGFYAHAHHNNQRMSTHQVPWSNLWPWRCDYELIPVQEQWQQIVHLILKKTTSSTPELKHSGSSQGQHFNPVCKHTICKCSIDGTCGVMYMERCVGQYGGDGVANAKLREREESNLEVKKVQDWSFNHQAWDLWSGLLKKSWHYQNKNLVLVTGEKLAGTTYWETPLLA